MGLKGGQMCNNIKKIRLERGLSAKSVYEQIPCSQGRYSDYERADDLSNVTVGRLTKIADILGVTVNDLIDPHFDPEGMS